MYKLSGVTKRYQKGRVVVDALAAIDPQFPKLGPAAHADLEKARAQLLAEKP